MRYETGVATYVDGVYYATPSAAVMSLLSIDRVEVLKGPQGTLFGRNTTGGLIHVVTRMPSTELSGNLAITYGNYDTLSANGYITGGQERVAGDLAFCHLSQGDGWGTNLFTDRDVYVTEQDSALRSSLRMTLAPNTHARLMVDYSRRSGSYTANKPYPGFLYNLDRNDVDDVSQGIVDDTSGHNYDVSLSNEPRAFTKGGGAALRVDHELTWGSVASITSYRQSDNLFQQVGDTTRLFTVDLVLNQTDRQWSQEFQVAASDASAVQWLFGLYWFDADSRFDPFDQAFGIVPTPYASRRLESSVTTQSTAAYGQVTLPLLMDTNLTVGALYTRRQGAAS